jgi:transcriptional pleiotropic regulator of transition state genes
MGNGVIRQVDKMGRVVIPKEFRDHLKVENEKDSFEIFLENDSIVLRKFQPTCVFCHRLGPSADYAGYNVCKDCIEKLAAVLEEIK